MIRSRLFIQIFVPLLLALVIFSSSALSEESSYFDNMIYWGQPMDAILMPWYDVTDTEKFVCLMTGGPDLVMDDFATATYGAFLKELTIAIQADRALLYRDDNGSQYMYQTSWYVEAPYNYEIPDADEEIEDIVVHFDLYLEAESGIDPIKFSINQDDSITNYNTNYEGASGFDVFYINHTTDKRYVNFSIEYKDREGTDHKWSVPVVEKELR